MKWLLLGLLSVIHAGELFSPPTAQLYQFDLESVDVLTLSTSRPGVNHKLMQEYLLWLEPNRLLWPFRVVAGLSTQGFQPYGGWEAAASNIRSHFTGHYLSALGQMFAATNDSRFIEKAGELIRGIYACQKTIGTGYVSGNPHWFFDELFAFTEPGYFCDPQQAYDFPYSVPFYTSHKLLAGLIDWHTYSTDASSGQLALSVALGLADHFDSLVTACIKTNTTWMWNMVMNLEFGGMAESLQYLYNITKEERYYHLAVWFEKPCFVGPLAQQHEIITGLHGNTHLPQVIGDAVRHEIDGNAQSRTIASYFWDVIVNTRTYATGGNTNGEHWQQPGLLSNELSSSNQETCVSYNMLKLSRHLIQWTADPKYADFAHRLFWNGIMGTMNPSTFGQLLYYTPLASGSLKNFGTPDNDFWCCYGTGVENWSGMGGYLWFHDVAGNLYIQNWFPNTLTLSLGVSVTVQTLYPDQQNVSFVFSIAQQSSGFDNAMNIIVPSWVSASPSFWINGIPQTVNAQAGKWATIPARTWSNGDSLSITWPMSLYYVPMPDDATMFAVLYGPVVLVGLTVDGCIGIDVQTNPPANWLRRTSSTSLQFDTYGDLVPPIRFIPLNEAYELTYTVYWADCSPGSRAVPEEKHTPPTKGNLPTCSTCKLSHGH